MPLTDFQQLAAALPNARPCRLKYRGKDLKSTDIISLLTQLPKLVGWAYTPYEQKERWTESILPAYQVTLGVVPIRLIKKKHIFLVNLGTDMVIFINAQGFSHDEPLIWGNRSASIYFDRSIWRGLCQLWNKLDGKSDFAEVLTLSKQQPNPEKVKLDELENNKPVAQNLKQAWGKQFNKGFRALDLTG